MASLCCSFFPLDVLDEIWDLTESVSEGFLTYFSWNVAKRNFFTGGLDSRNIIWPR